MRRLLPLLLVVAGCDLVFLDEPARRCDPEGAFGQAFPIAIGGAPASRGGARLSDDERQLVFHAASADMPMSRFYVTERADADGAFAPPRLLSSMIGEGLYNATFPDPDRAFIVLQSIEGLTAHLFVSRRTATGELGPETRLDPAAMTYDTTPYLVGSTLWFAAHRPPAPDVLGIHAMPLDALGSPAGHPVHFPELDPPSGAYTDSPVVSADGLTIVFATTRAPTRGEHDVWIGARASVAEPFGNLRPIPEVNTQYDDYPSWLSPDGCRLYLSSPDPVNPLVYEIRVAARGE